MLEICLISEEYLQIDAELALNLSDLSARLRDVVSTIADHYNDENLYLFFELYVAKRSDDLEIKEYAEEKYGPCSTTLLIDMERYANYVENLFPTPTK